MTRVDRRRSAIAVVGMALRVPGANTPDQFWRNIVGKVDTITRVPRESLRETGVPDKLLSDPRFLPVKPIISDIEYFDAGYFDVTPFDAERTDPGHRLFLECAAEALERAGVVAGKDGPLTGVFAGSGGKAYYENNIAQSGDDLGDPAVTIPLRLGNDVDFLPARVSFKLGLTGPSIAVQAACATSLIAIHLAVDSLRRGECDVALAGGANIDIPNTPGYMSGVDGMLSTSGYVRPFDASADGTIFGSGVGIVVLKPLEDAIADGNPIHAVILGSGTNNDGSPADKASFIAPSVNGQTAAIEAALSDAAISPDTIGYVESHGTGTRLGDPIEAQALASVYRRFTARKGFCSLGSVKGNVGHLRAAAGVTSFIKACLVLEHGILPPLPHLERPNPAIDFETSPFVLDREPRAWQADGPRRAAVSSFGFGGSNVHMVLEQAPARATSQPSEAPQLIVVSGRDERTVDRRLRDLQAHLDAHPDLPLSDVAHTLRTGRRQLPERRAVVVGPDGVGHLAEAAKRISGVAHQERPVVFLFPGQGVQRPGMTRDLYAADAFFRSIVDECATRLAPDMGLDLRTLLYPASAEAEATARELLRQTRYAQPALFTVSYALARLAMHRGLTPSTMLGHSIGEYAAACLAGVFSLPDALHLVALRGRVMQECEPGSMLAVFLPEAELHDRLGKLEVAAVNAPAVTVLSGSEADIAHFAQVLASEGTGHRLLHTSHGFHSRFMEPALARLRAAVAAIDRHTPKIPFISNLTGATISDSDAVDPQYWARQLRHAVRFSDGVATLSRLDPLFLELGPDRSLTSLIGQHGKASSAIAALSGPGAEPPRDEFIACLETLGWLWCQGAAVDWRAFDSDGSARKCELPTYPFQRQRYWIEPANKTKRLAPRATPVSLVGVDWRQQALEDDPLPLSHGTWLLFMDAMGLGRSIAQRLETAGARVLRVHSADAFEVSGTTIRLRPGVKSDLEAMFAAPAVAEAAGPLRVLHLWPVTGTHTPHNDIPSFETASDMGFHALLAMVQAASECGRADALRIVTVADALCALDGESTQIHAEKSLLLGPCRVLPQEIAGLSLRGLDVPPFAPGAPPAWLVDAVLNEACHDSAAPLAAAREEGRFVETLTSVAKLARGKLRLREGGTILITGGLGGLGLEVARDLYEAARARIVLLSRYALPPRETWPTRSQQDDKVGHAVRKLMELEDLGADVFVAVGDANDEQSLRAVLQQIQERFGAVNGVVHAAGVLADEAALTKRRETADLVLGAKVRGALILEQLLANTPLDFFVHFSSIAAQLPGRGRIDYTAANSVLDALARRQGPACHGLRLAIGWDAWKEVGMAVRWAERNTKPASAPAASADEGGIRESVGHPIVQTRIRHEDGSISYSGILDPETQWPLDEHRFNKRPLLPGTGIVECVRAAYADFSGTKSIELHDIGFRRPIFVDNPGNEIRISFTPGEGCHHFEVATVSPSGTRTQHTTGRAKICTRLQPDDLQLPADMNDTPIERALTRFGKMGKRWNCIRRVSARGDETVVRLRLPADFRDDLAAYGTHPALLDMALYKPAERFYGEEAAPLAIDSITVFDHFTEELHVHGKRRVVGGSDTIDVTICDPTGRVLVESRGYTMRTLGKEGFDTAEEVERPAKRLHLREAGDLNSFILEPALPTPPARGEVQIEVVAAGLNFRDVLSALGQLPGAETGIGALGSECSGVIRAVGEDVEDLKVGDRVFTFVGGSFATHVNTAAELAVRIPPGVSFEEAAGLPIAFLTADHGLNHLARLQRGERVLIHSGTGGVGLAAIQIARAAGAEIFATAGSPEKRDYLRNLGIENVFDSRSHAYVEEIRTATHGEGVDVVLNALAGEHIKLGFSLLRPFGRFIEIGKKDIYADTQLGLYPFSRNLGYFAFDLGLVRARRISAIAEMMRDLADRIAARELKPLPTAAVPAEEAARGFEQLARARHIGKIVLTFRSAAGAATKDGGAEERFRAMYGDGIAVAEGLKVLRQLLSSDDTPPHVIATVREVGAGGIARRASASGAARTRQGLPAYAPPTNADETTLVRLWQDMLGVELVGINDDFVALGGNSITALQILYGIRREFSVRLPATAIFENSTVARLAAVIRELRDGAAEAADIDALAKKLAALDSDTSARLLGDSRA